MSDGSKGTSAKMANTKKAVPVAEQQEKPKSKLTWKERLEQMPPEDAAEARAKAAEASRRSKAKKRGTTPEKRVVERLDAKLAKVDQQLADLKEQGTALAAELKDAKKALAAAEKAATVEETDDADDE